MTFCQSASYCDDEQYYNSRIVTARQHHKCCECGEEIKKKSLFLFSTIIFHKENTIENFKTCGFCSSLTENMDCHFIGNLKNEFESYFDTVSKEEAVKEFGKITVDEICRKFKINPETFWKID